MLRNSCAFSHEKRNPCVFQPMLMRLALLIGGLPAEDFFD
jgi:hypothetical protein